MKVRLTAFLLIIILLHRCASITTPSGGPKDKKAPALLKSIPENNQVNFSQKEVSLTFSEYIKLNNPKEEIIISPSPGKNVEIKAKGTRVFITPEDPWRDTTTYSIVFREGVQDITEGNSPVNLKLAFSTGPNIDSLYMAGTVTELLKGTPTEKITVALYSQDTFDIFTDTPTYFTKTDKRGKFRLENIKQGNYTLYAFDDKNKNLKAESRTERYGFLSDKINLDHNIDTLDLGIIMMDSRPLKVTSIRNAGTTSRIKFNKSLAGYEFKPPTDITNSFGDNQSEIVIWNPATVGDSLQLNLFATDSLQITIDTTFYVKKTLIKGIQESFKISLGQPIVDSETFKLSSTLKFTKPLSYINFDSIYIEIDTAKINTNKTPVKELSKAAKDSIAKEEAKRYLRIPLNKNDISINQHKKEMALTKELDKKLFGPEEDPHISLKARKGFVYSIDNDTSKAQTILANILWPEDTGILYLQTETKEPSYLIQLLDIDGKIIRNLVNDKKSTIKSLPPAQYQIRIVIDRNKNGQWDPGNIYKGIAPERVIFYKTSDGKQSLPIRANWELGPLVIRF